MIKENFKEKNLFSPEFSSCFYLSENPRCPYFAPKTTVFIRPKRKSVTFLRKFEVIVYLMKKTPVFDLIYYEFLR